MKWALPAPGRRVYMTDHALERYRDRVRPHLEDDVALHRDAYRLVEVCGVLTERAPEWANLQYTDEPNEPDAWLVCGDVAFVLAVDRQRPSRLVALTVITRGGISELARTNRNRRRSQRTHAKRRRNKMDSKLARRTLDVDEAA